MSTSGDRHLRPEPSGRLKGLVTGPRIVVVRAAMPYAGTFAGQVLLQLLVNLLCRQFGVIDTVRLEIPSIPTDLRAFPFPHLRAATLPEQLMALGRAVGGDEVQVALAGHSGYVRPAGTPSTTVEVIAGSTPRSEPFTVVAWGDGWDAFCSTAAAPPFTTGFSLVPYGPLLAACLASGAVFRHFHQVTRAPTSYLCLWDFGTAGAGHVCAGASLGSVRLPSAHLIGLGAVGAAFALALAMTSELSGELVGIDPQETDVTGRNRLLSAFYDEIDAAKVELAARFFEGTQIRFWPNAGRWPEYATDPRRQSPPDVRREEERFRYPWVFSCVDRNLHRQNIARYLPQHVLSGSTDGLVAQATYYAMVGPCECLACNHPLPTFSLEDRVEELHGLSPSERRLKYDAWGLAPAAQAAIDEYLYHPECGHAAEAELRRLGVDGTTDWSVGFVSAAAGVMLAASFSRCAVDGVAQAVGMRAERRLIFLAPDEFVRSNARRKPECSVCGDARIQARFQQRWDLS